MSDGSVRIEPEEVVIKDRARGCTETGNARLVLVPAVQMGHIDLHDAGDAFVADYLTERLSSGPVQRKLATAVTVEVLTMAVRGDGEGLPYRGDLRSLTTVNFDR